jgi:hypothetical protein
MPYSEKIYRVAWVRKPGEMYRIMHLYAEDAQDAADRLRAAYEVFQIVEIFHVIKVTDWR